MHGQFWLLGLIDETEEPSLLEVGTQEECELAIALFQNDGYSQYVIAEIVQIITIGNQNDESQNSDE